jgi:hypothetical protein
VHRLHHQAPTHVLTPRELDLGLPPFRSSVGIEDPEVQPLERPLYYDPVDTAYVKFRRIVQKFQLLQVGLSCFLPHGDHYEVQGFGFQLCPRAHGDLGIDSVLRFQASSVQFMAKNGYDFNLNLSQGIAPLTHAALNHLKESTMAYEFQECFDVACHSIMYVFGIPL